MNRYKKIFLVEDDKDDQFFFSEALKLIDPTVNCIIADNGYKALTLLATLPSLPDIIFLDLRLPAMDGFEFLTESRKQAKYQSIPIIVFGTYLSFRIEECYSLGIITGIEKANSIEGLGASLSEILSRDVVKHTQELRAMFPLK